MDGKQNVYRVTRRGQQVKIPALGLGCDDTEVPSPLDGQKSDHFVGVAEIDNRRAVVDEDGRPADDEKQRELVGLFAASIFSGTLAVILAPESERLPSYWFWIPLAGAAVEPRGRVGLFKKRPGMVVVTTDDLVVKLAEPARLFPSSRRLQARRSQELLDLLDASTSTGSRPAPGSRS